MSPAKDLPSNLQIMDSGMVREATERPAQSHGLRSSSQPSSPKAAHYDAHYTVRLIDKGESLPDSKPIFNSKPTTSEAASDDQGPAASSSRTSLSIHEIFEDVEGNNLGDVDIGQSIVMLTGVGAWAEALQSSSDQSEEAIEVVRSHLNQSAAESGQSSGTDEDRRKGRRIL